MKLIYNPNTGKLVPDYEVGDNEYEYLLYGTEEETEDYDEYTVYHEDDLSEDSLDRLEIARMLEEANELTLDEEIEYETKRGASYDLKPGFLGGAQRRVINVAGRPKTVKSGTQSTPWRHPGQVTKTPIERGTVKKQSGVIAGKKPGTESAKKLQNAAKVAANSAKKEDLLK